MQQDTAESLCVNRKLAGSLECDPLCRAHFYLAVAGTWGYLQAVHEILEQTEGQGFTHVAVVRPSFANCTDAAPHWLSGAWLLIEGGSTLGLAWSDVLGSDMYHFLVAAGVWQWRHHCRPCAGAARQRQPIGDR